jgi:flagellar assembly protein FliH
MAGDRSIVRGKKEGQVIFDFKPRELSVGVSQSARDFVSMDNQQSPDFHISELVAKQVGIHQLESEANEDQINERVLERIKEIQEKGYKEGYDLGLADGREKAFQDAQVEFAERLGSLDTLLHSIEDQRRQILVDNEEQFITLLFQIAKKISMRDLGEHREAVVEILQHLVEEMNADEKITAHVNQADLTFINAINEKSNQKIEKIKKIKFLEDDRITPGGCVMETGFGSVDASVEERVERAWQLLKDRVPQKRPGHGG